MKRFAFLLMISLPAIAGDLDTARQSVLDQFLSDSEPTALDAAWTDKNVFKVAVTDTGRDRDGYAEYVCGEIYRAGLKGKGILVRVVDYDRLTESGEWVNLGTEQCL